MINKIIKNLKYIIIIFIFSILFFILIDIQKEENIKESDINIVGQKTSKEVQEQEQVNPKVEDKNEKTENSNTTNNQIIIQQDNTEIDSKNSEEKITTNSEDISKEEYIEKEYKGYKVSSKLYIPKINLETYVLEKCDTNSLLISVGKFFGGEPNKIGNYCIAGHNYGTNNMFQNLRKLDINDEIYLTDTTSQKMKYIIYDIYKVTPKMTQCLSQKTNQKTELTLITCTLDSEKRIIIKARTV